MPEAVTEEQLVELERLIALADQRRPWRSHDHTTYPFAEPEKWIGYAWVGAGGEPDGRFDANIADLDARKDGSREYRESTRFTAALIAAAVNRLPALISTIRAQREALEKAKRLADLHFEPWGAAKGEEWERLSGDLPFSSENTVLAIQRALSLTKEPSNAD